MVSKLNKKASEAEDEIISENPKDIVDEDIIEEGDEDLEEITDEDLIGEEDEDIEESSDEDLIGEEDEDIEEDENVEEVSDEDYEEDEDVLEEDASCEDAEILEDDPIWRRLKRVLTGSRSDMAGNVVEDASIQRAVMDELSTMITKRVEARDSLVRKVVPLIGNFKYKHMTVDQVAKYACDKLDIPVSAKNAKAALKGYLSAVKHNKATKLYTLDSAIRNSYSEDAAIEEYLKGEK